MHSYVFKAFTSRAVETAHQLFERGPREPCDDRIGGSLEDGIYHFPFLRRKGTEHMLHGRGGLGLPYTETETGILGRAQGRWS